ncbi:hypothetical protein ABKV19_019287 [Rosa sericea]
MEAKAFAADKFKALTKSTQDFFDSLIHGPPKPPPRRNNPIAILKRLQREAFSDLMKLRDRQDKVEKIVSLYGTSRGKGSPFQEANTLIRGEFDHLGALSFMHNDDESHQESEALSQAGILTGIKSRFSVETTVRENDTLVAEFVASEKHKNDLSDLSECSLSLAKVAYTANVSDWLSAIAIPVGAQCRDVAVLTNPSHQGKGLTHFSSFGPPLLNERNGSAIGLMVKKSNVVASLAQFVSGQVGSSRVGRCFSTFGQVVCQLPARTKLSLLGLHQAPKLSSEHVNHVASNFGLGDLIQHLSPETTVEAYTPPLGTSSQENVSIGPTGSIALMLESEIDEITKIGGWIEMKHSNPKNLEWAVTVSDDSEDSFGWGVSLNGGLGVEGPQSWNHFQVESYLKLNLGKRLSVKPGITTHLMDGKPRMTALMLRSNWFL